MRNAEAGSHVSQLLQEQGGTVLCSVPILLESTYPDSAFVRAKLYWRSLLQYLKRPFTLAWVREKRPRRKQVDLYQDPTEPLRNALQYFSCQPNVANATAADHYKILKHQRHLHSSLENPPTHDKRAEHREAQHHRSRHQSEDYDRGDHHRDEYDREEHHEEDDDERVERRRGEYERPEPRRTDQHSRHQYTRDASPEPPKRPLKPFSSNSRSRPSRQYTAINAERALSSRWSNATTPLSF